MARGCSQSISGDTSFAEGVCGAVGDSGIISSPLAKRTLHPALASRAQAVKVAHAHLSKTVPGFRALKPIDQFLNVHAHLVKKGGK